MDIRTFLCIVRILFVYLVAIAILTMRCFAEDKKNKTDQMLTTAPVSLFEIVLGKYLTGNDHGCTVCDLSDLSTDH